MELSTVWFALIALLWIGYFVLEGFDFGVGMLLPVLGRDETDRRIVINSIGPIWDGNEVYLLVAGGATFAAFPEWYASLFSGFYLALLIILVALIVRGVAFEYRGKVDTDRWRRHWDRALVFGSAVPALLWGVAFANIVRGVPLDASHRFTGTLFTLLNPYALLGGLTTLSLFALHGAVFLALKTEGEINGRARSLALRLAPVTVLLAAAFLLVTELTMGRPVTYLTAALAACALLGAVAATWRGREGWAFTATATTIVLAVVTLFANLYPNVLPSTTSAANSLTVHNASSTPYTLWVMTVVALCATPIVLAYQAWTFWVFRKRLSRDSIVAPDAANIPQVADRPQTETPTQAGSATR
jgi:cytochrome d ubiquinol oxidase subunit II